MMLLIELSELGEVWIRGKEEIPVWTGSCRMIAAVVGLLKAQFHMERRKGEGRFWAGFGSEGKFIRYISDGNSFPVSIALAWTDDWQLDLGFCPAKHSALLGNEGKIPVKAGEKLLPLFTALQSVPVTAVLGRPRVQFSKLGWHSPWDRLLTHGQGCSARWQHLRSRSQKHWWHVQGVDVLIGGFLPAGRFCAPCPCHSMVHLQVHFSFLVVKYSLDSLAVVFVKLLMSVGREVALLLQLCPPAWTSVPSPSQTSHLDELLSITALLGL